MTEHSNERRKPFHIILKISYHIAMSFFLFAMSFLMLFANRLSIKYFYTIDPTFRYMFGIVCAMYASFRFYRGLKTIRQ